MIHVVTYSNVQSVPDAPAPRRATLQHVPGMPLWLPKGHHWLVSHAVAAALVAVVTIIRVLIDPWLGPMVPFVLYLLVVVVAAFWLDRWSSLTALVLGLVCSWFFVVGPRVGFSFGPQHLYMYGVYAAVGILIALMGEGLHKAAARAHAERRLFRATFDLVEVGLAQLDPYTARFRVVNQKLCELAERSSDELLLLTLYDLERSSGRERADPAEGSGGGREHLDALLDGRGATVHSEKVWHRRSGGKRIVEVAKTLVRDELGKPEVLLAAVTDITNLRSTNEALARTNEELEHFAQVVGHDLKEPLRGIDFQMSMLSEESNCANDPEAIRRVNAARRLIARVNQLLEAVLRYARSGRVAPQVCSLEKPLSAALENLEGDIAERRAVIERETPLPDARCDPERMALVFQNLIANALRYNTSEPPRVWVGARDGAVYVRDNGIGIPPHRQQEIFHIFKRLHGREAYGGGAGAGLAITRRIVESHGGKIWVESEPGQGSAFWFSLGGLPKTNPPAPSR